MDDFRRGLFVKAIGESISAQRMALGLSQEKVAELLGISREAVSRMETGVSVPSVVRIAELAEIFECGIEELIVKGSNRQLDQSRQIADLLDGLSEQHRAILFNVMKQLIDGFSVSKNG
jgi:transcriptional regulator with XRE-family HTH domain